MTRKALWRFLGAVAAMVLIGVGLAAPAAQAHRQPGAVVFAGSGLKVKLDHHPGRLHRTSPAFRSFVDRELTDLWGWADHKAACRHAPVVFVKEYRRSGVAFLYEGIYAVKGHPECAGGGNWQFAVKRAGTWRSPRALGGQDVPSCHLLRKWDIPRMNGAEQCYDGADVVAYQPARPTSA